MQEGLQPRLGTKDLGIGLPCLLPSSAGPWSSFF